MKLPKHNSEPLHVKAMKLKFILPLYFALATATFCGRKITEDKDTTTNTLVKETVTAIATNDKVTGTLELDAATNTIYADLWLKVSNHDFEFAHDFMPLQTESDYKGIAFRYYDIVNNAPDNGKDTLQIHAVFNFTNDMGWKVDDDIRVMSLDEETSETFRELKPYFLSRMDYFKNEPCNSTDLLVFNESWNEENPDNPVTTGKDDSGMEKKAVEQKKQQKMIPRLTKDDGILSLKLKK